MEYGKNFVGLIAVDAKQDIDQGDKKKKSSKQANTEATIKHLYIDEPYRSTGIQEDLLAYAIRQAFETPSIETIKVEGSPLITYVHRALLSTGFVEGHKVKSLGLLKWPLYEMVLDRTRWKGRK
jgi:hypothetical protein